MIRRVVRISDKFVQPLGKRLLDPKAIVNPAQTAVAAIAMAFALRKDGSLNLPTRSIVETTVQLYSGRLVRNLIFFGSGQANNITEAEAMAKAARNSGVENKDISKVEKPDGALPTSSFRQDLAVKEKDLVLLGRELKRLGVESAYLVAHPLHLWRARLLCENKFPGVTFYPVGAERLYDWGSNQVRCRAETFFIPWNILAFVEHYITRKI